MADKKVHDNEYLLANMPFNKIRNIIILPRLEVDEMYPSAYWNVQLRSRQCRRKECCASYQQRIIEFC